MFPQGTFLYNVYIQYDVSVRKKHCVKLMSKQRRFMSVFQGISGKYDVDILSGLLFEFHSIMW